jgi:hypothetical protein
VAGQRPSVAIWGDAPGTQYGYVPKSGNLLAADNLSRLTQKNRGGTTGRK